MFTKAEYDQIHALAFRPGYAGYKPDVVEIPNGDGKADAAKRYAHVAPKYFKTVQQWTDFRPFMIHAHALALQVSDALNIPEKYRPSLEYSALRILEYPPGAISNVHEDFDLFTLMLYRDQPDRFSYARSYGVHEDLPPALSRMQELNAQAHLGQLGTEIGLGPATPHGVLPSKTVQRSIVYFAIPDHAARLPSGITVREYLNDRMLRSRTSFKAYE
jgi:hypothetical protein